MAGEMIEKQAGKRLLQAVDHHRGPPSFPPPACPRCFSDQTKFCYYNNYSLSQPRYLCKNCRRYWTHGGALRNIPVGGTNRKRGRIDPSLVQPPPPATVITDGGWFDQTPFKFTGDGQFGGVMAVHAAVNGGPPPPPPPSHPLFPHLLSSNEFRDFESQFQPPPQLHHAPPTAAMISGNNHFISIGRGLTVAPNVVCTNEWSELDEGGPLQAFGPPSH